ncbi:class I SAM-dependent methyltransferase [Ktedonospora formicarum]|uniref:Methyltransferase domain-containing protein n=1 Tax=Ktedonospora formicarum TaxID=2778364 RepID=A0A8J3I898_9CHLR|nr:class I SAM-dependent methyltransferase [Ktedonospora formicarum]GHO48660.1 hypothetical protein KSX_68230 [Ktedonospora formicarum]
MTENKRSIFDPEKAEEMYRLKLQGEYFTKVTGLIEGLDPRGITDVVDLACGTGDWLINLMATYPHMRGVGVDISERMLSSCQAQSIDQPNIAFQKIDILKPLLEFDDNSFDLVNARLLLAVETMNGWPQLFREVYRILRPGGTFRLVESDVAGQSNSPALDQFHHLEQRLLFDKEKIPTPYTLGITPYFQPMLTEAGFHHIQHQSWLNDVSWSHKEGNKFASDIYIELSLRLRPLLTPTYIAPEAYDQLRKEMEHDLRHQFVSAAYIWGGISTKDE